MSVICLQPSRRLANEPGSFRLASFPVTFPPWTRPIGARDKEHRSFLLAGFCSLMQATTRRWVPMRNSPGLRLIATFLMMTAFLASLTSCAHRTGSGVIEGRWAPKEWTGGRLGAEPPRWEHVGPVRVARTDADPDREVGGVAGADESKREGKFAEPAADGPAAFPAE